MSTPLNLVVTGGHHTPAFAVLDELAAQGYRTSITWFGHRYSMKNDTTESAEYRAVHERGYPFVDLKAGKFYRTADLISLARIPLGLVHALYHLIRSRPHLVLSFGGYLAVPTAIAAWVLRIPVVTHEQTTVVGLANEVIARFATQIFIAWPESAAYFPPEKTTLIGNPLRAAVTVVNETVHAQLTAGFNASLPTLYITGGKQGAHALNEVVRGALPSLLEQFNVIHQCGNAAPYYDFAALQTVREELPVDMQGQYVVRDFFHEDEIGAVFNSVEVVYSRGGANTLYELAALAKPALITPLPHSSHNEQLRNAEVLANHDMAMILPQSDLSAVSLLEALSFLIQHHKTFVSAAESYRDTLPQDGASRFISALANAFPHLFSRSV